ncbi:LytTR family DNA-binding domain-containing protein [Thalassotalea fusca]
MELSRQKLQPFFIVAIVGVFIGFLRPFGMDTFPLHLTIVYWVLVCSIGYLIYRPCIEFSERYLADYISQRFVRMTIAVVVGSALFSLIVPLITWGIFSYETDYRAQYFSIFVKSLVIGSVFTLIGYVQDYIETQQNKLAENEQNAKEIEQQLVQQEQEVVNKELAQFMALLPIEKRGELICLEMSDHYLKVYTDKGHHMLLMRFKDALEKLENAHGIQTHRSWWVALSHVRMVTREGRKQLLEMSNNLKVPVSRTYAEAVKTANLK